jgi:hypothetical protein
MACFVVGNQKHFNAEAQRKAVTLRSFLSLTLILSVSPLKISNSPNGANRKRRFVIDRY